MALDGGPPARSCRGAAIAAEGAGEGPPAGAVAALADGTRDRARELGDEIAQLARALRESAEGSPTARRRPSS